jgi:hypothetical protein
MDSKFVKGEIGLHALQVASAVKGRPGTHDVIGVAPGALLYAGADLANDPDVSSALAANRIARINAMRAINVSYGREPQGIESTD